MKNVLIDLGGELHCWKCGMAAFTEKRTARSKVMFGVGALATKKKLKCQACGEYNDVGNADPFEGSKAEAKVAKRAAAVAAARKPTEPVNASLAAAQQRAREKAAAEAEARRAEKKAAKQQQRQRKRAAKGV